MTSLSAPTDIAATRQIETELRPIGSPGPGSAWITCFFVVVFYSSILVYGPLFLGWFVQPWHWVALAVVMSFPILLRGDILAVAKEPLVIWCVGYALFISASYVASGGSEFELFKERALGIILILNTYLVLRVQPGLIPWVQGAIAFCVVAGAIVNLYDISHPFVLVPATSHLASAGRAAGLYANANGCGMALLMGMILALPVVPRKHKTAFVAIALAGILLTLSRSAILCAFVAIMVLSLRGRALSLRQIASVLGCLALAAILGFSVLQAKLEDAGSGLTEVAGRLEWFSNPVESADESQDERLRVLNFGIQMLRENFWLGAGFGAMETWSERVGTHNFYLFMMVDHGVTGALVLPLLLLCVLGDNRHPLAPYGWAFVLTVAILGLFSHGVLSDYYALVGFAIAGALLRTRYGPWCQKS